MLLMMYTRGGVKYDKTADITQWLKGWSHEGIVHFNTLFDQVKREHADP
jgi:hypothetical protein